MAKIKQNMYVNLADMKQLNGLVNVQNVQNGIHL